jgi:hypothetical protein
MKQLMTERKAAQLATEIYARHRSGELSDSKASQMLDILSPYFSTTQFCKHLDWSHSIRDNPNFYQKKAFV